MLNVSPSKSFFSNLFPQKIYLIPFIFLIIIILVSGFYLLYDIYSNKNLEKSVYFDKVLGTWFGKMCGVYYGQYTEFGITWSKPWEPHKIIWRDKDFTDKIPEGWLYPPPVLAHQDDIGINLLNLSIIEDFGFDVSGKTIGERWVSNNPTVACANYEALKNMYRSFWPPLSGNPAFNKRYRDIDAQIDNDIFGMISPGMPNTCEKFTFKWAKVTNSEEGVYPAVFVTQCISNAFFESNITKIIKKSLKKVPSNSKTASLIRDVIKWSRKNKDWRDTRQMIAQNYPYPDIFALPNLGFVLTALLYGNGDFEKTIQIATFCGYDSDCNPATACGILGTILGDSHIPDKFKTGIGDYIYNYTAKKYKKKVSIREIAERTVKMGERVILDKKGKILTKNDKIYYKIPVEILKSPRIDRIPETWEDIRKVRMSVRDKAVKILSTSTNMEEIKDSINQLIGISEIEPDFIDSLTKATLFITAQKFPVYASGSAKILARVKDPRSAGIFLSILKFPKLDFQFWKDIHQLLLPFYEMPEVHNFFIKELLLYKDRDTSRTLALIPIFKDTPEEISLKAIEIIKKIKNINSQLYQEALLNLHYHPSLKVRDKVELLCPRKNLTWNGWEVRCSGDFPLVGVHKEYNNNQDVLCTHPFYKNYPAYLSKWADIEKDGKKALTFQVAPYNGATHFENIPYAKYATADWVLEVFIDGKKVDQQLITWKNKKCQWLTFKYDLSSYSGKKIGIILQNTSNDWYWEQAFWSNLKIVPADSVKN